MAAIGPVRIPVTLDMDQEQDWPYIGQMVHYVSHGTPPLFDGSQAFVSTCRAAVVTEHPDPDGTASLCVLNPTGQFFNQSVRHDEGCAPGTWHWLGSCCGL